MAQSTIEHSSVGGVAARTSQRARLDRSRYISSGFMQQEWLGVWSRCWLFAGLAADVDEPGDYLVYEIGAESVVVVRDEDGELRAFYNVCQHRGNRLLVNHLGSLQSFNCPYHGWQYGLDGALRQVPDAERFRPPIDYSARSLTPVRVSCWAGLVWICMDEDAPGLAAYLGSIVDELAPFRFERMRLLSHQVVDLSANWKTVRDNFLEQYHVDFIHPQHASLVDCCNSTNFLWPLGHSASQVHGYVTDSRYPVPEETPAHLVPMLEALGMDPAAFTGRVPEIRAAVQKRKRQLGEELGLDLAALSDEQLSDVWQYDIFPNTFMTVQAEELWIFGPRPHVSDPDRCYFDLFTLQLPLELAADADRGLSLNPRLEVSLDDERPVPDCFGRDAILAGEKSLNITVDQDIQYLPDMQAGLHSRGFDAAVLNQDEVRVQHFHDWVDEWIRQEDKSPPQ